MYLTSRENTFSPEQWSGIPSAKSKPYISNSSIKKARVTMFGINGLTNLYYMPGVKDMRLGYARLSEIVRNQYNRNPQNGDAYFFISRDQRRLRVFRYEHEAFEGFLQTNCYSAYKYFDIENSEIDHIVCMAHVRAKFKYAQPSDDRVIWFLEHYRKRYSLPILERIHKRAQRLFRKEKNQVGTLMYNALNYLLNCYTELKKYVNQGYYTIDNSQAERSIRPVTVGRKNYGHFGSELSSKIAALYYSLIETCKMRGANVKDYFTNFFRLEKQGMTDYANMLLSLI